MNSDQYVGQTASNGMCPKAQGFGSGKILRTTQKRSFLQGYRNRGSGGNLHVLMDRKILNLLGAAVADDVYRSKLLLWRLKGEEGHLQGVYRSEGMKAPWKMEWRDGVNKNW